MQASYASGSRSIRMDIHEPASSTSHAAIVLMHGAGGNIDFWIDRLVPQLTVLGAALYAPHYFDRTDTVRADPAIIADGIHVPQWLGALDDALAFVASRPGVDPQRVALIGISLGAFLSLAFAAQISASPHPAVYRRVRALVEVSGGLAEPYAESATPHFPPTLILHGDADSIVGITHAEHLRSRLRELNVEHETHILGGEGHWFSGAAQMQLFLLVSTFLLRYL